MRVLAVRPSTTDQDIAAGREALKAALADPSTIVMVIRGNDPHVATFANSAAARGTPFPWRNVVWVTDTRIFRDGDEACWFGDDASACAVVFDLQDTPVVRLPADALLFDVEDAFLTAERRLRR